MFDDAKDDKQVDFLVVAGCKTPCGKMLSNPENEIDSHSRDMLISNFLKIR